MTLAPSEPDTSLPLAIPSYVAGLAWVSVTPLRGFWGAFLVLTVVSAPYVTLPVLAALRRADLSQEHVARTLGASPWRAFFVATFPQILPAAGASALLVGLYTISDFGVVAIMRYPSFTWAIHTAFGGTFNRSLAIVLSLVLVVIAVALVTGERLLRRRVSMDQKVRADTDSERIRLSRRARWSSSITLTVVFAAGVGLPGIVMGLSMVYLSLSLAPGMYQTIGLLVIAYGILFVPKAAGSARAAVSQVPANLEDVSRTLGRSRLRTWLTVTGPIASRGILAGTLLVALTAMKELPATLMMRPTGMDTLATRLWQLTDIDAYGAAAPYALTLIAVASTTTPAVTVRGVCATYEPQEKDVLHDVHLTIHPSELLAILGPSGSGKTTLLRAIAGLHRISDGEITVDGRVVADRSISLPPEQHRVGLVPQDAALFPHRRVRANIEFGLKPSLFGGASRSDRKARALELLDLVALTGFGDRYPDQLSGGQRQRVALARALAPAPTVVLLDEAFGALDASLRSQLRLEVRDILRQSGTASVLVTHDQDEALSVADRVAIMRDGHLVQVGTPQELYSAPVDLWTANFLGECTTLPGYSDGRGVDTVLGRFDAHCPQGSVHAVIRPENLTLSEGSTAEIVSVEFRGPSSLY